MEQSDFTKREMDVIKFLVRGLSNAEIAKKLSITTHTTKIYVSSVIKKLNAKNRLQAAILALKSELV